MWCWARSRGGRRARLPSSSTRAASASLAQTEADRDVDAGAVDGLSVPGLRTHLEERRQLPCRVAEADPHRRLSRDGAVAHLAARRDHALQRHRAAEVAV